MVQIAAIKVDASDGYREVDSFSTLVRPRKNPQLSDYFVQLTKITQEQLDDEGTSFEDAMAAFVAFAHGGAGVHPRMTLPVWGYGTSDATVVAETARVQGKGYV